MWESNTSADAIYSELADDPDLSELVQMFVDEIPQRIERLEQSLQTANWEELGRIAHQLKGASGSYGFHSLTAFALRLERAVKDQKAEDEVRSSLDELVQMCKKLRGGTPRAE